LELADIVAGRTPVHKSPRTSRVTSCQSADRGPKLTLRQRAFTVE
jgi:hypothetical protein